jgi:hypothetical protein
MAAEAVYGFVGVLLGSATTAVLTVYRERLVSGREREVRQQLREQDRKDQRDTFQRRTAARPGPVAPLTTTST